MYQNELYRPAILRQSYPVTEKPMGTLRQCSCGRMTYLSLPCANCGKPVEKTLMERKDNTWNLFRITTLAVTAGAGLVLMIAAMILVGWIPALLALILTIAMVVMLVLKMRKLNDEDMRMFWMFHLDWRRFFEEGFKLVPSVEPKAAESIVDAWYLDVDRLELLAKQGKWDEVQLGARQLRNVFRNRRLALLEYQALLHQRRTDRDAFQLNEICSYLQPSDIPAENVLPMLKRISEAVRDGSCSENNDSMKPIFEDLLARHLNKLQFVGEHCGYNVPAVQIALGTELFAACGGVGVNTGAKLPASEEETEQFFRNLCQIVTARRRSFVESGKWYGLLRGLRGIPHPMAKDALRKMEVLFFRDSEYTKKNMYYALREGYLGSEPNYNTLLPEQRKYYGKTLALLEKDANGVPYKRSPREFLRKLTEEYLKG